MTPGDIADIADTFGFSNKIYLYQLLSPRVVVSLSVHRVHFNFISSDEQAPVGVQATIECGMCSSRYTRDDKVAMFTDDEHKIAEFLVATNELGPCEWCKEGTA